MDKRQAKVDDWVTVSGPDDWVTVKSGPPPSPVGAGIGGISAGKGLIGHIPFTDIPVYGQQLTEAIPYAGGAVGGIIGGSGGLLGGTLGATIGGAAGKAGQKLIDAAMGWTSPPPSPTESVPLVTPEDAIEIGLEGAKQGALEAGGRALGAAGGLAYSRLRGTPPEPIGSVIGGVKIPETAGQAFGKPGGILQTGEHYLSGTFLGEPLRKVRAQQEVASRQILANLSKASTASPEKLAENWAMAREETRVAAKPLYESLGDIEAPSVGEVAQTILKSEDLGRSLSGKAKDTLMKLASDPREEAAKLLGYRSVEEMTRKLGGKVQGSAFNADPILKAAMGDKQMTPTVGNALAARHELGDLATHAKDRNDRRLLTDAWNQLNDAINSHLSPEELEVKREADLLYRRSYIMERFSKTLERMENSQNPKEAPTIAVQSFVQAVNKLARENLSHEGEKIIRKPSELSILFDSPEDRKAMVDLASFLATKYQTLRGKAGISEGLARIGVALEAISIPALAATGQVHAAGAAAAPLVGMYALSNILARPGGALKALEYFKGAVGAGTAQALRIAVGGTDVAKWKPEVNVNIEGPPPKP